MNYGYTPDSPNWKPRRVDALVKALKAIVEDYSPDHGGEKYGDTQRPYVEVNGLYPGVRIRRITNLSEADCDKLVQRCDEAYEKVMVKP